MILKSSYAGDTVVPVNAELASKRIIFLEGEIDQKQADKFAKEILYLVLTDSKKPIHLIINSSGGEIDAGLKMCDIVSNCPCKVNAYCFSRAYSMAAVLFESVNGDRCMVGHSKLMFHQPSVYGLKRDTAGEIEELSKQLSEKNDLLLSIVADRCEWNLEKLKEETIADRFFDGEEATKLGLANQVITFGDLFRLCENKGVKENTRDGIE